MLFLLCCATNTNFAQVKPHIKLREGDLLFQRIKCGALCEAIESVTSGVNNKKFSHCAMVVNINDTLKIIEAIRDSVQINSVNNFFARSNDTSTVKNICIGRVKDEYKKLIAKASAFAIKQVGKPYDDEFIIDNGAWYCSELIYEAFKYANHNRDFFSLAPMTFKSPVTKQFFPAWADYYYELQKPISEGKPGINPGLISRSIKINILK
jgi:uncharacterized protein YycO